MFSVRTKVSWHSLCDMLIEDNFGRICNAYYCPPGGQYFVCYVISGAFTMHTSQPEALWSTSAGDALWISKKNREVSRRIANGNWSGDARLITCCPPPLFSSIRLPFERLFPAPCIMVSHVSVLLLVMKRKAFRAATGKLPCGTALFISADCSCFCLARFYRFRGRGGRSSQLLSIQSDTKLWLPLTLHLGIFLYIF